LWEIFNFLDKISILPKILILPNNCKKSRSSMLIFAPHDFMFLPSLNKWVHFFTIFYYFVFLGLYIKHLLGVVRKHSCKSASTYWTVGERRDTHRPAAVYSKHCWQIFYQVFKWQKVHRRALPVWYKWLDEPLRRKRRQLNVRKSSWSHARCTQSTRQLCRLCWTPSKYN